MKNIYWVERFDIEDASNPHKFKDEVGYVYPTYCWMTPQQFLLFALSQSPDDYNCRLYEVVDDFVFEYADLLFYEELVLLPKKV